MTVYILVIAVLIVFAAGLIYVMKEEEVLPEPTNNSPVLDNHLGEWLFFMPLKNGNFLFRSPEGKIKSYTLHQCEQLGFLTQFDFASVQKV